MVHEYRIESVQVLKRFMLTSMFGFITKDDQFSYHTLNSGATASPAADVYPFHRTLLDRAL